MIFNNSMMFQHLMFWTETNLMNNKIFYYLLL